HPPKSQLFPYTTLFRSQTGKMKGICPILAVLKGPAVLASHRFGLRKPASLEDEPGNYSADIREYRGCTPQEQERFRLVARRKSRSEEHTSELQSLRHLV